MEDIQRRVAALREDREHGASFLAAEALRTLAQAAAFYPHDEALLKYLRRVGDDLVDAKPAMAAVKNAVGRFVAVASLLEPLALRLRAHEIQQELLEELRAASETAARNAAALLGTSATVVTCSYSSAVIRTCGEATAMGKAVRVLALESGSGTDSPGQRMARELRGVGLEAEAVPDAEVARAVARADVALVGADAVLADGTVVNGSPTLTLAQKARGRLPLYVVCERHKFTSHIPEVQGYDRVPGGLVTAIVTEDGTHHRG